MNSRFFNPFIGSEYQKGCKGYRILILGASHYCVYNQTSKEFQCQYWGKCTSAYIKDSSMYNECCPYYDGKDERVKLEDTTIDEITRFIDGDSDNDSYTNFFSFLGEYLGINDYKTLCNKIAFANYVQYFVSTVQTPNQTQNDIKNFEAFLETLEEIQPNIIIVWGTEITEHFQKNYIKEIVYNKLIRRENDYFWDLYYNKHKYIVINPYHPCDYRGCWSKNLKNFTKALDQVFKNDILK